MSSIEVGVGGAKIFLSKEEIEFILQAMNEVCNGIWIPDIEFQTRIGFDRADGDPIMQILGDALGAIKSKTDSI